MKIMHIVGNRPQFIKLAVLYPELAKQHDVEIIVHTGQHFDSNMSQIFFQDLQLPQPDHDLGINQLSHNQMIGSMLIALDKVLQEAQPNLVIVYGDTNSTLAGAIAARKKNIRLVHIEAGVRTGNEYMPEEANRLVADRLSDINFCCTYLGMENLRAEGFSQGPNRSGFHLSGDLMLDAVKLFGPPSLNRKLSIESANQKRFVLATLHRQENNEDLTNLRNIIEALNILHKQIPVIFPMHPKTKSILEKNKIPLKLDTCEPLGYIDMLHVLQNASSVVTDSGGLSREAFFFCKPTIVLMQHPFWPELFVHGNCLPSSAGTKEILSQYDALLQSNKPFNVDIFGNGHAAENISQIISSIS